MAMMNESSHDLSNPLLTLADRTSAGVTPLEQEVLDEYTRLLKNMNHVRGQLFLHCDFSELHLFEPGVMRSLFPLLPDFLAFPFLSDQTIQTHLYKIQLSPITSSLSQYFHLIQSPYKDTTFSSSSTASYSQSPPFRSSSNDFVQRQHIPHLSPIFIIIGILFRLYFCTSVFGKGGTISSVDTSFSTVPCLTPVVRLVTLLVDSVRILLSQLIADSLFCRSPFHGLLPSVSPSLSRSSSSSAP
jgi:hypothetical protein